MKKVLTLCGMVLIGLLILTPIAAMAQKDKEAQKPAPAEKSAPAPEAQKPAPAEKPAPAPVVQKPAVTPPAPEPSKGSGVTVGIGDMKVSGIFQAQYNLWQEQLKDDQGVEINDTDLKDAFVMKRARVFLIGSILPDKVKYVFQGEACNSPWLLDARLIFVNVLPQTEIQVGRFLSNFTYYMPQLVSKLDFVNYPLLTSNYAMWRQVGIQSTTKMGITSLNVGILNSINFKNKDTWTDSDNWKDFLLRFNVKPNDKIESAVYATLGQTGVAGTSDYLLGVRVGAFLRATVSDLTTLAEILYAMDESDPDNVNGITVYGQAGYKVVPKVEPMIRVEYYEPNLDGNDDEIIRLTGGVNYYISGQNAMLSLNVVEDLKNPENLFQLYTQAQVAF